MSKYKFKTEIGQLLDLITHSLYSNREIFVRELISNSSDALDKLKYLTLTDEQYKKIPFDPRIDIRFDEKDQSTISVEDCGIGMNEEDLKAMLGTIASSGTRNFLNNIAAEKKDATALIGQFGVGFYSAFMVADKVEVVSRKAGEEQGWLWSSNGKGQYEISQCERASHGTTVTVHLNDDGKKFANRWNIEQIIKKYSDHIAFKIFMHYTKKEYDKEGKETGSSLVEEQANDASALWKRSKSDLSVEDYHSFYKTFAHNDDEPLHYIHTHAEGALEYTTLFFIPKQPPHDLYNVNYTSGIKLYVKRVFITDDAKQLLPTYLRFVRGVIDSEDLPLNVSREMLQQDRVLVNIRSTSVKRLLNEFAKIAEEDSEKYSKITEQYNRLFKEGVYQDYTNRDTLFKLIRFKSTHDDQYTSLEKYKERMLPDQKAIYYLIGKDENTLRHSPLLEIYAKKKIEVLLLDDEIDDIIMPGIGDYKELPFKPINRSQAADEINLEQKKEVIEENKPILERIKKHLGDRVKSVIVSARLHESPSCIIMSDDDISIKMQQVLRSMGTPPGEDPVPTLEINPDHPLVKAIGELDDEKKIEDLSFWLLEQALLLDNVQLGDPTQFVKRLNRIVGAAL